LTVDQDVEGSKPFSHPLFLNQDVAPEGCDKGSKPFSHPSIGGRYSYSIQRYRCDADAVIPALF
jgi:hypothetical protein